MCYTTPISQEIINEGSVSCPKRVEIKAYAETDILKHRGTQVGFRVNGGLCVNGTTPVRVVSEAFNEHDMRLDSLRRRLGSEEFLATDECLETLREISKVA